MDGNERSRLLTSTSEWFSERAQVIHYVTEVPSGLSEDEEFLLRALPSAGAVLDVGAGAGRVALQLAARGYDVVGVDVSESLIDAAQSLARQRGSSARFLHVEPLVLPFDAASFEAALAIKLLCYIPSRESRVRYLGEIGRVLRPGAPLVLTNYIVPSEQEAIEAMEADQHHRRAAAHFHSLEPLDTFSEGRGYVHWFTRDRLREELDGLPAFELERFSRGEDSRFLQSAILRRRHTSGDSG